MLQMFEAEHPEIGQEIEDKKVLTEELIDKDRRDSKGI